ncbi:MAG: hypothetical protein L6Q99_07285 [Planctomycetes bacterium]|nr:hypothetical protein [Planctomycetota bacterium]
MSDLITTRNVLDRFQLSEPAFRHILRRPDAPRPALHPTARLFLWTNEDVERLGAYLEQLRAARAKPEVKP